MRKTTKTLLSSTATIPVLFGLALAVPAFTAATLLDAGPAAAQTSPCAAKKACNPCNPCNPCAAKKTACNPCAAKKPCNPCNPCAAKKPCNPCAAKTN